MATASILLSQEHCGFGLISLTVDYATRAAESLTHALNDPGRLGAASRALLHLERERMGGFPVDEVSTGLARYCPNLRKLQVMQRHGLQLTINGKAYNPLKKHWKALGPLTMPHKPSPRLTQQTHPATRMAGLPASSATQEHHQLLWPRSSPLGSDTSANWSQPPAHI